MHYVYLIASSPARHHYIVCTTDLRRRLADHNAGKLPHTSPHKPWRIVTYLAFSNPTRATQFEHYLKSGSGHAFAHKRLW
jgi:predicted GIY-YIG superfamily endonuclease